MSFCSQLTKLRKNKKLTQCDLASKLNVKQYVISSWETGRSEPNIEQLSLLSEIFEVPIDYLLDKVLIRTSSIDEFNSTLKIIEQDNNDEFIKSINSLCSNLSDEKKKKILELIKISLDM